MLNSVQNVHLWVRTFIRFPFSHAEKCWRANMCKWVGCSLKWDNHSSFTSSNRRFEVFWTVDNRMAWGSKKEDSTSALFY